MDCSYSKKLEAIERYQPTLFLNQIHAKSYLCNIFAVLKKNRVYLNYRFGLMCTSIVEIA
jgi:hypothetical protein